MIDREYYERDIEDCGFHRYNQIMIELLLDIRDLLDDKVIK